MRIEVVNTGTELLLGKVVNTHVGYFGEELFKLGLRIQRQVTIPDGEDIREVLAEAFPRCDAILITGGLGPTSDDVTREVIAEMLGRELHLDSSIRDEIREMFRNRGLQASQSNDRQAMVPHGAEVLTNPFGTAPGLYLPADADHHSPHLFLMPGPPRELKPMFENLVYPRLTELRGEATASAWHNLRVYGVGESALASVIEPQLAELPEIELGYCARLGEVDIRFIGQQSSVDKAVELVRSEFGEKIVTETEDSIAKVVLDLLVEKGETVSTAESCTGGFIVSTLTDESGSSAVLKSSYVTYANEAKTEILGVSPELLQEYGAVSNEVARAMAEGCLRISGADHAIAVSGIAGPTGGSEEKPVGTVHIAIASKGCETFAKRYFHPSDRVSFKWRVTRLALDLLRRRLQGFALDY